MAVSEAVEPGGEIHFTKQRGLWSQAWSRMIRNRLAVAAAAVLLAIILMAILTDLVPAIEGHAWDVQQYESVHQGPSGEYWLGTDNLGRDIWARIWEGTRISLKIGIGSQIVVLTIGLLVGGAAALGGRY
ncbi:MAG: hypothetical protein ACE5EF_12455, partial [Dehalococcoidia bacterium]